MPSTHDSKSRSSRDPSADADSDGIDPVRSAAAGVAAWAVPGLGHVLLGEHLRGGILAAAVIGLWLCGLLIGGLSVVDRTDDDYWFLRVAGHNLIGMTKATQVLNARLKPDSLDDPAQSLYRPSFGRVKEQGVLYTGLAGFLNLLVILDVVFHDPQRRLRAPADSPPQPPSGTEEPR